MIYTRCVQNIIPEKATWTQTSFQISDKNTYIPLKDAITSNLFVLLLGLFLMFIQHTNKYGYDSFLAVVFFTLNNKAKG